MERSRQLAICRKEAKLDFFGKFYCVWKNRGLGGFWLQLPGIVGVLQPSQRVAAKASEPARCPVTAASVKSVGIK